MKWGSTAASGSSFRVLQPSTSFKAGSRTEATPTFFLNAPYGAGCLPTLRAGPRRKPGFRSQCTFWCRVLTNFADSDTGSLAQASQYTVWCWVLIDRGGGSGDAGADAVSQYTVWCWVLIDHATLFVDGQRKYVSIHRVVLGAYRLGISEKMQDPE